MQCDRELLAKSIHTLLVNYWWLASSKYCVAQRNSGVTIQAFRWPHGAWGPDNHNKGLGESPNTPSRDLPVREPLHQDTMTLSHLSAVYRYTGVVPNLHSLQLYIHVYFHSPEGLV